MLTAIASAPLTAASASAFEGSVSPLSLPLAPTLVVIDSGVDDAVSLAAAVQQGAVVILQEGDGIAEITAALQPGTRRLVLVAHGEPGVLHLGGVTVTAESLAAQRQQLQDWNVAEIVLCSCRVGVESALVKTLAQLTGSQVVATDEILGAGHWLPQMEEMFEATMLQRYSGTLNVSSVTSTTTDATYGVGSPINVTVNFSEALNLVGGDLILTLDSGATLTIAPFSGQTSAVATYTVGSGQASADLNVTTISLAGGATLKNGGGVDATLTIPVGAALKDSRALVIDGIAPVPSGSYNGFSAQSTFATGSQSYSMTAGDFNGDGKADLAIANRIPNTVSVLLGTGSGGFSARSTFAAGTDLRFVTTGDFNGDGKADLAIANFSSNTVSVLLGNGSGGFSAPSTFATGTNPRSVTVGDFNGDSKPDMAIANQSSASVSVLLGNGSGGFSAQSTFATGAGPNSVTVGDFNGDSKADMAIANQSSNSVSVLLGNGSGSFSAQSTFATGTNPRSVTVGDFNGDSKPDMAIANQNSGNVSVLLGNGSGGFSAQSTFATGSTPFSVTVGDFNGDSKADLATANIGSNNVSVLLGNGSGGFSAQSTFATGSTPIFLTVGDFNGDSKPELAIANYGSNTVSVLLNNPLLALALPANGTYAAGQPLTFTVRFSENVLVTGTPVLPLTIGSSTVNATYQSGSGTSALTFTYTVTPGNLDADGIAVANALTLSGGSIKDAVGNDAVLTLPSVNSSGILVDAPVAITSISSTQADGAYSTGTSIPITLTFPQTVTLTGSLDVTLSSGAVVSVPAFSGTSTTFTYTVAPGQASSDLNVIAVALASGATLQDGASNNVSLTTLPTGTNSLAGSKAIVIDSVAPVPSESYNGFSAQSTFAAGNTPRSVTVGDFNGDSKPDLAIVNRDSNTVSVTLGNGSGGFSAPSTFATGSFPYSVTVGDFNGDSKADMAIANNNSNTVSVLLGTGSGGFSAQSVFAAGGGSRAVTVGDFNGDGKQDLAIANYSSNTVSVLLGTGSGGFSNQTAFATGANPASVTVGDLNGDGKQDLAIANRGSNTVSVLLGTGSGGFSAQSTFATGSGSFSVRVADFNGDSKPDLAIANFFSNTVSVLLGTGSGGFSAQSTFATGSNPRLMTVADFNGDSKADLATANQGSNNVSVLLGNGSGGFSAQSTFAAGSVSISITGGDFNGDSKADLAIANQNSNTVSVLLNNSLPALTLPANGTYGAGQPLTFTVNFSEVVLVTGTPVLPLTLGSTVVNATYQSGSGSNLLTFTYTVTPGNLDADGIAVANALALSGGTIKDAVGNDAVLTLPTVNSSGILVDTVAPSISLSSTAPADVNGLFSVTATFSEPVTSFISSDITATNGTITNFNGSGSIYTFDVTPTSSGAVDVNIAANVAQDATTNGNTAATVLTRTADLIAPTVALSSTAAADVNGLFSVTATFSEPVTSFISSDIIAINGTITNFSGTGSTYTFDVTPTSSGAVDVNVAANVVQDAATNGNTVATVLTRTADLIAPTVALSSTAPADVNGLFSVTATFSEPVTSFISSDITATNGTITNFSGTGSTYTFDVTPTSSGAVDVNVAANVVQDAATNGNTVATVLTRTADLTIPTVTLSSIAPADVNGSFSVTATFSEPVTNFISSDIAPTNGTVSNFSGSGTTYTFDVTPTSSGAVDVNVAANVAQDAATNGNTAATALTRNADLIAPTVALSSTAPADVNGLFSVTATFSEPVTSFISSDIIATNGTITNFNGSGSIYTFDVTPTSSGAVDVNVAANVAQDVATNGNTVATVLTRTADLVSPTLTTLTTTTADGTYGVGKAIDITVNFSENVTLANGNLILTLSSGATLNLTNLSGTNTATGTYTVIPGEASSDLDVTAIALTPGATLKDPSGNNLDLTLPTGTSSLAGSKAIVIDAVIPAIASITSTTADGTYNIGKSVNVTLNFSKPLTLTGGNLSLALDSGATLTLAPFSNTSTATATYTVAANQTSPDLNVNSITLASGATLTDSASNNANLTIPTGQALKDNKAIVIGRSAPKLSGTPILTIAEDSAYTFTPTAVDPDPEILTFSILNKPSWATFNSQTGKLSGTPINTDVGTAKNIIIRVNDGTDTVSLPAFDLTVTNVNDAPLVGTPILLTASQNAIALQPFSFAVPATAFTDPDGGDILTFNLSSPNSTPLPAWLKFDSKTRTLSGTPDFGSVGDLSLKVTATDSKGVQVSQNFKVAIANPIGTTGIATNPINFSGGKKGITRKATKGELLRGTNGNDILRGTNGNDRIKSSNGKDKLYGLNGSDRLVSGGGNDYLDGGKGNDTLTSSQGRDLLIGGKGNDKLLGGKGEDILVGGQGNDTLRGGANKDMFAFSSVNDGMDTITDFNVTVDVIDLRTIFTQSQFSGATPYVRYLQQIKLMQVGSNTEVRIDADGKGIGTSMTTLASLQNVSASTLTAQNFVIA